MVTEQRDINGKFAKGNTEGFQLGESGNPSGRPKDPLPITAQLRKLLSQEGKDGKTNATLVAEALVSIVKDTKKRGYVPALKELLDRIEGRVTEKHEIEATFTRVEFVPKESEDATE